MKNFQYNNNILYAEQISLFDIASSEKTPFYIYSEKSIRDNARIFHDTFKDMKALIAYSLKANSNQAILKILAQEGLGADVVSEGEMRRALYAGIPANKIVYSGVGKTSQEIDFALKKNIFCFNVESESELVLISERAVKIKKNATINIRVNPDIDAKTHKKISTGKSENKFGIPISKIKEAYDLAESLPRIVVHGIDMHIGSQICNISVFENAFKVLSNLIDYLLQKGHRINCIDVGGGLGIAYSQKNSVISLKEYFNTVKKHIQPFNVDLILEPGRFIVANSGMLITSVVFFKKGENRNFIIVDSGMNDLMRPSLYNSWHEILPVCEPSENQKMITADIVGPICETSDFFGKKRKIPVPNPGDLLAISNTGAYGSVMSNNYNSRLLIPEILVKDKFYHVIRSRTTYQELIDMDNIPSWL